MYFYFEFETRKKNGSIIRHLSDYIHSTVLSLQITGNPGALGEGGGQLGQVQAGRYRT